MAESKQPCPHKDHVRFDSNNCDLLELNEENTQPGDGKISEAYRQYLEKKYGHKPPLDPPAASDGAPDAPNA